MNSSRCLIVLDLEATCWGEGDPLHERQREESEIIEIGAVFLIPDPNSQDWIITEEFDTLVKPVRHPLLTEYCTNLTTITQAQVEEAPLFPEAWARFLEWAPPDARIASWGIYDFNKINRECSLHGLENPWPHKDQHVNLKEVFSRQMKRLGRSGKGRGLLKAVGEAGLEFSGTQHRGIDDARMTALVGAWLLHPDRFSKTLQDVFRASQNKGRPLTLLEVLKASGARKEAIAALRAEARDLSLQVFQD